MSTKSNATSTGIGFGGLLSIAFIVLKLTNVITWSWWWVLSPVWMPLSISLIILIVWLIVVVAVAVSRKRKKK